MKIFEHIKGTTFQRALELSSKELGTPIDLTGATIRAQLRTTADSLIFEATAVNNRLVIYPELGRIDIEFSGNDMNIPEAQYFYDLEIVYASGKKAIYDQAIIKITKVITHD